MDAAQTSGVDGQAEEVQDALHLRRRIVDEALVVDDQQVGGVRRPVDGRDQPLAHLVQREIGPLCRHHKVQTNLGIDSISTQFQYLMVAFIVWSRLHY